MSLPSSWIAQEVPDEDYDDEDEESDEDEDDDDGEEEDETWWVARPGAR